MHFNQTLALFAILAALSGCALIDDLSTTTRSDSATAAVQPPPRKPPAPGDVALASPSRSGGQGPLDLLGPKGLVGLGETQVAEQVGKPLEVSQEGPATIWRYAVDTCRMDVFFYADLATGERHVLTYEIDAGTGAKEGEAAERCLRSIRSASGRKG